jgi:phosphate:Na+ symporter
VPQSAAPDTLKNKGFTFTITNMVILGLILRMIGGLCMFLFGMKVMSDGIQKSAGDRLRKTLNFMTGNRFVGVLTGFVVTGLIQSSSAVTVMVVSFVNAGLLTLTQSIGVIMGANIGTTVTAWIVSLFGFSLKISELALPAIGIGFIFSVVKWKYKSLGELVMGFGLLFLGLFFLTQEMRNINNLIDFNAIALFRDRGFIAILIGAGAGLLMTMLTHSSSASTAIIITMAYSNIVTYEMAAGMILGANIGTTIDAVLAAIGAKTAAKRTALVHVLFNVIGTVWALPLIRPLLALVDIIIPGNPLANSASITTHIAMLHTVFNIINTMLFLPFVNHFARLVSFLIREGAEEKSEHYKFAYFAGTITDTPPELKLIQVENEIRDMAGIVSSMYASFSVLLRGLHEINDRESAAEKLCGELKQKEEYTDEMRESLTVVLIECTREQLNPHSEQRVSRLLRVISGVEEMSDECYSISRLLEKSVRKNSVFKNEEMSELIPYVGQVENFLEFLHGQLGQTPNAEFTAHARELETNINKTRKQLQKLSRKRIKAGGDVKMELIFIDLVNRIEKLGDYCAGITETISG